MRQERRNNFYHNTPFDDFPSSSLSSTPFRNHVEKCEFSRTYDAFRKPRPTQQLNNKKHNVSKLLNYIAELKYQKLWNKTDIQRQYELFMKIQEIAETQSIKFSTSLSSSFENYLKAFSEIPIERNGTIYYYLISDENCYESVSNDFTTVEDINYSNPYYFKTKTEYLDKYNYLSIVYKESKASLIKNGYPYFEDGKKEVQIQKTEFDAKKNIWVDTSEKFRNCCRCKTVFKYKKNGGVCNYHPMSPKFDKKIGARIHECCNEFEGESKGCEISKLHVYEQIPRTELEKFQATPKSEGFDDERNRNIFGLDCEMVYTIEGPTIARVTMVDLNENIVLDTIVKPSTKILDANTFFSGLTIEQIENDATDTLETCIQKMFKFINERTILIGQSLESDLKALRLSHMSIIDTAIMFQNGSKYKPSLRTLARKYLNKSIQRNNPLNVGHDSIEDARTCVQIINYLCRKHFKNYLY